MAFKERLKWFAVDAFGRPLVWLWTKSCRLTVIGEPEYLAVRRAGKAVVHMMWHGKIFIVPYFFRSGTSCRSSARPATGKSPPGLWKSGDISFCAVRERIS